MPTTVEFELDDIHALMFKELNEDNEDADLDEWSKDVVKNILYQSYQSNNE